MTNLAYRLPFATVLVCVPLLLPAQQSGGGSSEMSETFRSAISKVVVVPGESPSERGVSGSYEKGASGLYGGMVEGGNMSTVSTDIGPIMVNFPIPILQIPGMIFGGIRGSAQKELQDFRDALTDDLIRAPSKPLSNEKIALDVYSDIRTAPKLDSSLFAPSTPIPEDTDAVVFVSVNKIGIEVDGSEAIITTTAKATVTRPSDEEDVYQVEVSYQDRDTLSNWTDNENAVWRDYTNFARHYIARELAGEVFSKATVAHTLQPDKSDSVKFAGKNVWQASSKKLSPTLAWQLELTGAEGDPAWLSGISEDDISYDVEIYDLQKPVYSQSGIPGLQHAVTAQLDACKTYRWSVRPAYHFNGEVRYGDWMRSSLGSNGNIGKRASEAPAYIDGFAVLEIKCGSK